MELSATVAAIQAVAKATGLSGAEARWYLFGSILRVPENANDVDLLLVTDSTARAVELRKRLHETGMPEPLHLITMTQSEEKMLHFIGNVAAVEIYPQNELAAQDPPTPAATSAPASPKSAAPTSSGATTCTSTSTTSTPRSTSTAAPPARVRDDGPHAEGAEIAATQPRIEPGAGPAQPLGAQGAAS